VRRRFPWKENPEDEERADHHVIDGTSGGLRITAGGPAPLSDTPMHDPPGDDPYELEQAACDHCGGERFVRVMLGDESFTKCQHCGALTP
jgi:hypothetical protein